MKEKLEQTLRKEYNSWIYAAEIVTGVVAVWADQIFDFPDSFKRVYDIAIKLGGTALIVDGTRRIGNIAEYYKKTIMDYLKYSQD